MIRTAIVSAALVAAALATPAAASDLKVAVAGKTAAQVEADISSASRKVCRTETSGDALQAITYRACFRATYGAAVSQLADPQVAAIAQTRIAQR